MRGPVLTLAVVVCLVLSGCGSNPKRPLSEAAATPIQRQADGSQAVNLQVWTSLTLDDPAHPSDPVTFQYHGLVATHDEWNQDIVVHNFSRVRIIEEESMRIAYHFDADSLRFVQDIRLDDGLQQYLWDRGQGPLPDGPIAAAFLLPLLQQRGHEIAANTLTIGEVRFTLEPVPASLPGPGGCTWLQLMPLGPKIDIEYYLCRTGADRAEATATKRWGAFYIYAATTQLPALGPPADASTATRPDVNRKPWTVVREGPLQIHVPPWARGDEPDEIKQVAESMYERLDYLVWTATNQPTHMLWGPFYMRNHFAPETPEFAPLLLGAPTTTYRINVHKVPMGENQPPTFVATEGASNENIAWPDYSRMPKTVVPLMEAEIRYGPLLPKMGHPDRWLAERSWQTLIGKVEDPARAHPVFWIFQESCKIIVGRSLQPQDGARYAVVLAENGQLLTEGFVRAPANGCGITIYNRAEDDGANRPPPIAALTFDCRYLLTAPEPDCGEPGIRPR